MPLDLGLSNQVAVVTGASRGLGAETARQLAAEGVRLGLVARNEKQLQDLAAELAGTEVLCIPADLSEASSAERIASAVLESFGGIDILINSAGAAQGGIFWEIPDEVWESAYALKLMGTIRMIRAVIPAMRKQCSGRIVTIAGDSGKQPDARMLPGGSANVALLTITKGLADELGPDGIAVNAVNPGPTRTGRLSTLISKLAEASQSSEQEVEAGFLRDSATGELGDPQDVARVVVFLASPAARNITGTSITTDGGRSRALA